jgi:hypothetical protein
MTDTERRVAWLLRLGPTARHGCRAGVGIRAKDATRARHQRRERRRPDRPQRVVPLSSRANPCTEHIAPTGRHQLHSYEDREQTYTRFRLCPNRSCESRFSERKETASISTSRSAASFRSAAKPRRVAHSRAPVGPRTPGGTLARTSKRWTYPNGQGRRPRARLREARGQRWTRCARTLR